jgi:hypothetical protein
MKRNEIVIKHKEINGVIKELKILNLGLYLQSENFKNLLNEFDFYLCWQLNINKIYPNEELRIDVLGTEFYEGMLFQMLDNIWGCSSYEFHLLSKQILNDFNRWNESKIDTSEITRELQLLESATLNTKM